jgi:hypothetical protein
MPDNKKNISFNDYFLIPENKKNFKDIILRNVMINSEKNAVAIAIQYSEKLVDESIEFIAKIDNIGDLSNYIGHNEIDGKGEAILLNSQESIFKGDIVSEITCKKDNSSLFLHKN